MTQVNVHQAKTQLSKLLERVESGEEVVIARAGTPIARLSPYAAPQPERKPDQDKGRVKIADDFDAELPEDLLRLFEA